MPTDALYASLRPNIERALYKVLRERPPDFQDLLQITYERVIRGVRERKFEGRSELKTWASVIAVHVAMDYLRRRSRDRMFFDSVGDIDAISGQYCRVPLDRLEARSEMRKVRGVLGRMRPRRAAVLVLHDVLGYAAPEIAERLGIGARAVYSTLRRARTEFARRCTPTSRVYKD